MDQQNIFVLGCLTLAVAISAFILWGPSPRPKKKSGQIVGLVNLGSTCFLNTLLQALASCALFLHWLGQQKQGENSLTSSLQRVLWVLNGGGTEDVYAPLEVLKALKSHGWMVSSGEQDAHELFNMIMSTLQEESTKTFKMGSLSDALLSPDTLSQASDILEDVDETQKTVAEDSIENENLSKFNESFKQLKLGDGEGDNGKKKLLVGNSSSDTLTNYEDATDKLNHGDSISHSSTMMFYSLEEDSLLDSASSNNVNYFGNVEESPVRCIYKPQKTKESEVSYKLNPGKSYIQRFKTSQESFKEKSPDFSGYYDRVSGCSPCLFQADSPPFQGLLTSTLQCSECGHHSSIRYDTFDSVSLPLSDTFHFTVQKLQDLLQKFVKTENIPDVDCEKCCRKTIAYKTLNFGKLPLCLCLRIARTAWQSFSSTPTKREDFVDFPEYLPMDDYTVSARLRKKDLSKSSQSLDQAKEKNYKHLYRLKSVVVHLGGVNSGHFLTYRRGALNTENRHRLGKLAGACMDSQRWYLTSDHNVKLSTMYEAMDSVAYMLFYEKCFPEAVTDFGTNESTPKKVFLFDKDISHKNQNGEK